jgi:hypothetical protein
VELGARDALSNIKTAIITAITYYINSHPLVLLPVNIEGIYAIAW